MKLLNLHKNITIKNQILYLIYFLILLNLYSNVNSEKLKLNYKVYSTTKNEKLFLYDNNQFVLEVYIEELCEYENLTFYGFYELQNKKLSLFTQNMISTYFSNDISFLVSDYFVFELDYADNQFINFNSYKLIGSKLQKVDFVKSKNKTFKINDSLLNILNNTNDNINDNSISDTKTFRKLLEKIYDIQKNHLELRINENGNKYILDNDFIIELKNKRIIVYLYTANDLIKNTDFSIYENTQIKYKNSDKILETNYILLDNNEHNYLMKSNLTSKLKGNKINLDSLKIEKYNFINSKK